MAEEKNHEHDKDKDPSEEAYLRPGARPNPEHGEGHGDSHNQHEAYYASIHARGDINFANWKRTFDEYQDVALTQARRSQMNADQLNNVALQALQNAVETANQVGKNNATLQHQTSVKANRDSDDNEERKAFTVHQGNRHADIAMDHQWNPVQQGAADAMTVRAVSLDDAALKAIGAIVAASVAENLRNPPPGSQSQ